MSVNNLRKDILTNRIVCKKLKSGKANLTMMEVTDGSVVNLKADVITVKKLTATTGVFTDLNVQNITVAESDVNNVTSEVLVTAPTTFSESTYQFCNFAADESLYLNSKGVGKMFKVVNQSANQVTVKTREWKLDFSLKTSGVVSSTTDVSTAVQSHASFPTGKLTKVEVVQKINTVFTALGLGTVAIVVDSLTGDESVKVTPSTASTKWVGITADNGSLWEALGVPVLTAAYTSEFSSTTDTFQGTPVVLTAASVGTFVSDVDGSLQNFVI
jgi:hypothetical protein